MEWLLIWAATRLALVVVASVGPWLLGKPGDLAPPTNAIERWNQWDVSFYSGIAITGYQASGTPPNLAFLPGLPLLLKTLHGMGIGWVLAGVLLSLVAAALTVVGFGLVIEDVWPGAGRNAVLLLGTAPSTIFLSAGYPEPWFLCGAVWAFYFARNDQWWPAGVCAAAAMLFRVNGLFLAASLGVLWLVERRHRTFCRLLPLALPILVLSGWIVYLHALTGDWFAWQHAQATGWKRHFVGPVASLRTSWIAAFRHEQSEHFHWYDANFIWMARAEIVAVTVGLFFTGWLVVVRRWAEAAYVFFPIFSLATSTWYFSVPRSLILAWPIYGLLAALSLRFRWVIPLWFSLCAPLAILFAATFFNGRWAG
ncbi:MAG: hypothetical protein DI536_12000 [Archangium gephyra]|uniref:Glycosyltransferase RgtA/B/C/D-like domain-containing protein n=1 Tax=Archangium gephyra TaxID=48 RepID=A0A2W5TQ19_9BACT|nr:MAG: hypothetical protein DI536_12000 [Archangium gephyra]